MHQKMKILDLEDKGDTFQVKFEVPGELYNQAYPKRLAHTFPNKESFFEEDDDGVPRFERILRKQYLERHDKEEVDRCKKKLEEKREEYKGKKIE